MRGPSFVGACGWTIPDSEVRAEGLQRVVPSPPGRRCRGAADEGPRFAFDPKTLTRPPATLSRGERIGVVPSPPGRRCRAAADEGPRFAFDPKTLTRPSATLSRR